MTVREIISIIDTVAPFSTQEEWDNSGLLIGSPSDEVTGILLALDVTDRVIDEACALGASLIITHHPLMFVPRKTMTDEDYEGRLLARLIRSRISLISAHTNLDQASGGVNDVLAALCGISGVSGEGFVRFGSLTVPMNAEQLADKLAETLSCTVRLMGPGDIVISQAAVASGGGGEFWKTALDAGCQAFITGEIRHHEALAAADSGLVTLECGHFATEEPGIRALAQSLQTVLDHVEYKVGVFVSEIPAYAFPSNRDRRFPCRKEAP